MHQIPEDSAWAPLAARLLHDYGPERGTALFCTVLDELGASKVVVPRRESFFAKLWQAERDALIRQLASRPNGEYTRGDLSRMFGVSEARICQVLGTTLNRGP